MDDDLPAALSLPQRFTLVTARTAVSPVIASSWCPTMDLIAIITASQQLHVHRLAWERLFMLHLEPPLSAPSLPPSLASSSADWSLRCVVWRPDGKALAVGCSDGSVQIVSMESRRVELHYRQHAAPITALLWTQHSQPEAAGSSRRQEQRVWRKVRASATSFPLKDRTQRFFPLPLPPLPASASSAAGPAPSPVPLQATTSASSLPSSSGDVSCDGDRLPPSLLLSADSDGIVHARLHGTMDALHLDLRHGLQQEAAAIVGVALAGSYGSLTVTLLGKEGELRCLTLPLPPLSSRVYELSLLSCHLQHIARLLSYAAAAVSAVLARYAAIRSSLSLKFSPLATSIVEQAAAPAIGSASAPTAGSTSTPQDELIRLLFTSCASPALMHFVNSSLHAPALQRQYNTLSSSLYRMADALQSNVKRAAEEAVYRLAEVRGWSRWKGRCDGLGVEEEAMQRMLAEAGAVMLRVEQAVSLIMRVRRCFGAFFSWFCRAVSLLAGEEEEKAQPAQPVDVDDVLECINCDLFSDRLGALLSDASLAASQPADSDFPSPPPLPPSVSLIASGPTVATLLSALDTLRASFLTLSSSPSSAISQRVLAAAEQRGQRPLRIKLAHGGEEEAGGDVALCYDDDSRTQTLAFSTVHPLLPYPLIVVIASSLLPPAAASASGRSVLAFSCPGLTSSSHPTVVSVSFFSPSLLLLLVRYSVQRRSSELRHLHEQQRMLGNSYTRLWQVDLQQLTWTQADLSVGVTAAEWAVREVEEGRLAVQTLDGRDGVRQRCLYGECGRSVVSGKERGVCCVLLTALQPHRARQQRRRVLLLDVVDDAAEEEEEAEQASAAAADSSAMED